MSTSIDELPEPLREAFESIDNLEPISPDEAIEEYCNYKEQDIRPQTLKEYRRKLSHFQDFCEQRSIKNLNDINGRTVHNFRQYRRLETAGQDAPLSTKTMRDDLYLFRDFIEYLGQIEAVPSNLSEKVDVPEISAGEGVRDIDIDADRVDRILNHLEQYEYATREHVVWLFHAHTGRRPGCLYAIDLGDLYLDNEKPYVKILHRPGETELKNGDQGERELHLTDHVAQVFRDYIQKNRIETTTENDREPFLTSRHGRLSKTTMRKYVYRFSRPCVITGECPHDREIDSCQAAQSTDVPTKCPSIRPPYALRHGYISSKRGEGVPDRFISGRCDVSPEVIEKHYDERDESEKRELRQKVFEEISDEQNGRSY